MRILELQQQLGMSDKQIASLRLKHHRQHGRKDGEAKLEDYLRGLWLECRDLPRIPARQAGMLHPEQYVAHPAGALPDEPESPDREWLEDRASEGQATFEIVKAEELAKREARSRAERVRQAEIDLRRSGQSTADFTRMIETAVETAKGQAKAA